MTGEPRCRASDFAKQPWHFDKSVPIGLIAAILLQTAAAVWFIAKMDARIGVLELSALDNRSTAPRLAVVEAKLSDIKETVGRIESRLSDPLP